MDAPFCLCESVFVKGPPEKLNGTAGKPTADGEKIHLGKTRESENV